MPPKKNSVTGHSRNSGSLVLGMILGLGFGALITVYIFVLQNDSSQSDAVIVTNDNSIATKEARNSLETQADPRELQKTLFAQMAKLQQQAKAANVNDAAALELTENVSESTPINEELENEYAILRNALPYNMLLPGRRSEGELREQLDNIEEQQYLKKLVAGEKATQNDLNRIFEIKSKRLTDEMALLDYCENNAKESSTLGKTPLTVCSDYVAHSADIRMANESAMTMLQTEFENGFKEQPALDENTSRRAVAVQSNETGNQTQSPENAEENTR